TITYMINGRMRHHDNAGHEGVLESGGIQWMIAGKGIIHSEMPEQQDGLMQGFQLWLNLPAKDKMCMPWYQNIQSHEIPEASTPENVRIKIIAGICQGIAGAIKREATQPLILDLHLPAGTHFNQPIAAGHNAFTVVYEGRLSAGTRRTVIESGKMAIWNTPSYQANVTIQAPIQSKALLISGAPLNEPIVQYGPFVMNSEQEIMQALEDFNRH
ncbi:MAG: pirin family protein, partial [Pseudomonadota bacterium]|nr:pirin family protein [Pseudomonadota bacterium]